MKSAAIQDHKKLYLQSQQTIASQEQLIAHLQQQLSGAVAIQQQQYTMLAQISEEYQQQAAQLQQCRQEQTLQQQTIAEQAMQLQQQQEILHEQGKTILAQQKQLSKQGEALLAMGLIKHDLRMHKRRIYGRKSEKLYIWSSDADVAIKPGEQLPLAMEVAADGELKIVSRQKIRAHERVKVTVSRKGKHPGRKPLPEHLPRVITLLEPPNKPEDAVQIGVEVHEELACKGLEFIVNRTERPVYMSKSRKGSNSQQLIAPLPVHPLPKCKADVSVLAMLAIDKYLYHFPMYRERQRFLQYGVDIPYNTLICWLNRTCHLLKPLYDLLLVELIRSGYIHVDETTYRVLDLDKDIGKKSHIGYMWGLASSLQNIVCFQYGKGRGMRYVNELLDGFKGYLQSDGYAVYDTYGKKKGIIHLQCMAHARRYFWESRDSNLVLSDYALQHFFGPLYDIEEACRQQGLCYDEITEKRQKEAVPVLDAFYSWLLEQHAKATPRTPFYKAVNYCLERFKALRAYTQDGMLSIDNLFIERSIRPIAMGRRSHLFAGSHEGGQLAAIMYSLLGTCKLQGIDSHVWLTDVLSRIKTQPEDKLIDLLPQRWKPACHQQPTQ